MSRILMFDKEESTLSILSNLLRTDGFRVDALCDREEAAELAGSKEFSLLVVLADDELDPDFTVVRASRQNNPSTPIIFLMSAPDPELETRLQDLKAYEVMVKPLKIDALLAAVQQAVDYYDVALTEEVDLNIQLQTAYQFAGIVSASAVMKSVCEMVNRVAGADVSVLFVGEPGTGKGQLARVLHEKSRRAPAELVEVDCASEQAEARLFGEDGNTSALQAAQGGTMLLRHVTSLGPEVQRRLCRVLSSRELVLPGGAPEALDLRLVASAPTDLDEPVKRGAFYEELARLLKIIMIRIPPLRERTDDILPIMRQIMHEVLGDDKALPALGPGVAQYFEEYSWPGNVNELRTTLSGALRAADGENIEKRHLPPPSSGIPLI